MELKGPGRGINYNGMSALLIHNGIERLLAGLLQFVVRQNVNPQWN